MKFTMFNLSEVGCKKSVKQRGASALDRLKDKMDSYPIRERVLFFYFLHSDVCVLVFRFA